MSTEASTTDASAGRGFPSLFCHSTRLGAVQAAIGTLCSLRPGPVGKPPEGFCISHWSVADPWILAQEMWLRKRPFSRTPLRLREMLGLPPLTGPGAGNLACDKPWAKDASTLQPSTLAISAQARRSWASGNRERPLMSHSFRDR
jgi:hypothetical protein